MDSHRSSYPEEQDPRWYGGEQYAEPEWDNSYDGFRVPDARGGERYAPADAAYDAARVPASGPVGRRSGEPLPPDLPPRGQMPPGPAMAPSVGPGHGPVPGGPGGPGHGPGGPGPVPGGHGPGGPGPGPDPSGRFPTEALRRPPGAAPSPDNIYRARRPGAAVVVAVVAGLLALPLLRVLIGGLGSPVSPGAVISSVLLLLALPLGALGGYGLLTGAARVPDVSLVHVWLRPPLAYLTVALVLCVAAGLAAG